MVPRKKDNPHVPVSPQEIIADARRCREAGAAIVHVHARDSDEQPTYRADVYREIISGIRRACPDLIVSASTSGRLHKELWQRSEVLELEGEARPDLASLTLGSLNFPKQASLNPPEVIQGLATRMNERGIVPEWEIFDLGFVDYAQYLIQKGFLLRPYYCNILLGNLGTLSATPEHLDLIVRALPPHTTWSATGIGRFQFSINELAIRKGGHVRVGLEDNLFYDVAKTQPATNVGLIERLVKVAAECGRKIASPDEARLIIGLSPRS